MLLFVTCSVSTWINTCKLQPRLAVIDQTQLGADAAATHIMPTSLSPGCWVCLVLITPSWISFADISTPLLLNPFAFPHSFFHSFPIVSFVLQTEQWYCLSEAHLFPCPLRLSGWICRDSGHTWCTGGQAHDVHKTHAERFSAACEHTCIKCEPLCERSK